MNNHKFGSNDIVLLIGILSIAFVILVVISIFVTKDGDEVVITVDGKVYRTYALSEEQEIPIIIDGVTTNVLTISDGKAKMTEADCPDKLCMHQKAISKTNESIVCLPNKVVVTVDSKSESEFDSIAR